MPSSMASCWCSPLSLRRHLEAEGDSYRRTNNNGPRLRVLSFPSSRSKPPSYQTRECVLSLLRRAYSCRRNDGGPGPPIHNTPLLLLPCSPPRPAHRWRHKSTTCFSPSLLHFSSLPSYRSSIISLLSTILVSLLASPSLRPSSISSYLLLSSLPLYYDRRQAQGF